MLLCCLTIHVESFSLRLKFWSRNGTPASCLCNLLHYIILLCHILHCPLHAGMPWCSPCRHFHLPRWLTSFSWLAFIYQITLPESLFPASASLNSMGFCMSQMCAVSSHYSPPCPPTGGVRDRLQHKPTDNVTGEYQRSFECSTVAFKILNPAESLGLFFSLIHMLSLTTVRHNLRQRETPQNTKTQYPCFV